MEKKSDFKRTVKFQCRGIWPVFYDQANGKAEYGDQNQVFVGSDSERPDVDYLMDACLEGSIETISDVRNFVGFYYGDLPPSDKKLAEMLEKAWSKLELRARVRNEE